MSAFAAKPVRARTALAGNTDFCAFETWKELPAHDALQCRVADGGSQERAEIR